MTEKSIHRTNNLHTARTWDPASFKLLFFLQPTHLCVTDEDLFSLLSHSRPQPK